MGLDIGRLNAGIRSGFAGRSLSAVPVATMPMDKLKDVTSLRQVVGGGLLANPRALDLDVAHAVIDAGNGQGILAQVRLGGKGLSIDRPFGDANVTRVHPQIQSDVRILADRLKQQMSGDPWYAREYGKGLTVERTDPSVVRLVGWDTSMEFAGGKVGTLRAFDMDRLT